MMLSPVSKATQLAAYPRQPSTGGATEIPAYFCPSGYGSDQCGCEGDAGGVRDFCPDC